MAARVESRFTVPASTTLSVSSGALTSAVSVTWPAASYFHTAAGGVSSGLAALTSAINAAVSPYPDNATSVAAMLGYGNFASGAGWGFNIASGNDSGLFGGVTMTAVSTPTYHNAGPGQGTDYAVGFDSALDAFSAGDTFDLTNTDDMIVAWIGYFAATPNPAVTVINKITTGAGWHIYTELDGTWTFRGRSAAPATLFQANGGSVNAGTWHVGIATVDRATGKARIGTCALDGSPSVSSEATATATTSANAVAFRVGDDAGGTGGGPINFKLAGLYIVTGSSVATGLSANLSTALTNFKNAVNSAFTVSMSTSTGLVTLSNSAWPCAMTMDDDTQSLLGFAYDFDYPTTVAQMATAFGDGTWSTGWLCNEASGDLVDSVGAYLDLVAASTPTYSNLGARGGTDKAVGLDSASDAFGTASQFDVSATQDLIAAFVVRFDSVSGNRDVWGKWVAGVPATGYLLAREGATLGFYVADGVDFVRVDAAVSANVWNVVVVALSRATNQARIAVAPLTTGTVTASAATSTSAVGALTNANAFGLGNKDYGAGTTQVSAFYVGVGVGAAGSIVANISTVTSAFATYMRSQTGTQQAKGVWFPDCPLNLDSDPAVAPKVTDRRSTQSPTGQVLSLVGNYSLRHKGVRWEAVARSQIWESAATYANGSFETFADDCLYGLGHAWFTPSSPLSIWWNDAGTDRALGYTHNSSTGVPGWYVIDVTSTEPKQVTQGWTGLWRVDFGDVVGVGS